MKTISNSKKNSKSKSGVLHIDPDVHKDFKIYCVKNDLDIGKYASQVIADLLNKKGVKS
jgi:hypothetical protein